MTVRLQSSRAKSRATSIGLRPLKKPFEMVKPLSKSGQPQKDMSKEAIEATEPDIQARQLPNAGWPECFERIEDGGVIHLCNAIHVFEGIGEDGQLYLRRVWGLSSVEHPPEDFCMHDWEPMFQPDDLLSSLDDIRTHLNRLVEDQSLTLEEWDRSEAFYSRLFAAKPSSANAASR